MRSGPCLAPLLEGIDTVAVLLALVAAATILASVIVSGEPS